VKAKIIAVDVDNTLTNETCWTCDDCENATPRQDIIDKVNELYNRNYIVIHTSRRHELYASTIKWLKKNGVKYHSVHMEKMVADLYIDDKAINVEDI